MLTKISRLLPEKERKRIKKSIKYLTNTLGNFYFLSSKIHLKNKKKIIYALTPPPRLKNVGDHAQVIAIRLWLKKHFPKLPVIELDKDQVVDLLPGLKRIVNKSDIIFLQSGGNIGERGLWSENARRLIINTFRNNKIVSLTQTIQFGDNEIGRLEKEKTKEIYNKHPDLVVFTRDPTSDEVARILFPALKVFCMPDFVLSLPSTDKNIPGQAKKGEITVMLCLRTDTQSSLSSEEKNKLFSLLQENDYNYFQYETLLDYPIKISQQEQIVNKVLKIFKDSDAVITDRLHGLIFAIQNRVPCVAISTRDHKISASMHWFKDIPFIKIAYDILEIPKLLKECLEVENRTVSMDWNKEYFDKIPALLDLEI